MSKSKLFFFLFLLVAVLLFLGFFFWGKTERPVYNNAAEGIGNVAGLEGKMAAVIVNNPTDEQIKKVASPKRFTYEDERGEPLLLIPKYNNMTVQIKKIKFAGDDFIEGETIFEEKDTADGFGLLLFADR